MFLIISKLPTDLQDVIHILPFWFDYLYWFLIICGVALIAILLIFSISRLVNYLKIINEDKKLKYAKAARLLSREEALRKLKHIFDDAQQKNYFREGLYEMSALLRTYFEITLKQEIEEMTAREICTEVKSRTELGVFFTDITVVQFQLMPPVNTDLKLFYERAVRMVGK